MSDDPFDFLKKPIHFSQDGKTCIVIHERAQTELGRLLCLSAKIPFHLVTRPNPRTDSGEWESYEQAVINCGNHDQARWVMDYYHLNRCTDILGHQRKQLTQWCMEKIRQNWYLLDLLVNESLPIVFVYHETQNNEQGEKVYIPMTGLPYIQHEIRNLRKETIIKRRNQQARDDKREQKKARKQGLPDLRS